MFNKQAEIKKLITLYQLAVDNLALAKKITPEQQHILNDLAGAMLYDRDVQELIGNLGYVMHLVNGGEELIKQCLLAKEFKTANLIAQGYTERLPA